MKLWAISDLHLGHEVTRRAIGELPPHPDDWLILAGDVGETEAHLHFALRALVPRFRQLFWVPGNHDLWSPENDPQALRGEAKYRRLVKICRSYGVLTPEDPYLRWPAAPGSDATRSDATRSDAPTLDGPGYLVAPLFLLYDYSFRPAGVAADEAVAWAAASGVLCSDEYLLQPAPYPSRQAWCAARLDTTAERLGEAAASGDRLILVNHWPLRQDLVTLRRIPRFSIWCGTKATEDWHRRFNAAVVVYGHLHVKATHFRDGVRFEEVSLGYPRDWGQSHGVVPYLRQILPPPDDP